MPFNPDFGSGVLDVDGGEIKSGDRVRITINHSNYRPTVCERNIEFIRGAFRVVDDDGREYTPVGDFSYNCDIKIIGKKND